MHVNQLYNKNTREEITCTTTHVRAGRRSSAPNATRRGPPDREEALPPGTLPPPAAAAAAAASSTSLCLFPKKRSDDIRDEDRNFGLRDGIFQVR